MNKEKSGSMFGLSVVAVAIGLLMPMLTSANTDTALERLVREDGLTVRSEVVTVMNLNESAEAVRIIRGHEGTDTERTFVSFGDTCIVGARSRFTYRGRDGQRVLVELRDNNVAKDPTVTFSTTLYCGRSTMFWMPAAAYDAGVAALKRFEDAEAASQRRFREEQVAVRRALKAEEERRRRIAEAPLPKKASRP
jgi:hypothetical protein